MEDLNSIQVNFNKMASLYPLDQDSVGKAVFVNALQNYKKDRSVFDEKKANYGK
jgi:hypothetical protein